MEKIYLLILSIVILNFNSTSQTPTECVVDENSTTGVTPDDLDSFCQDMEVNQVIQITVPASNTFLSFESIEVIVDENTLPTGLSIDCPNDCKITASSTGLTRACFTIYGTPTTPNGVEQITLNANIATNAGTTIPFPYTIETETIPSSDSKCITGIEDFEIESALSIYPNPSQGNAYINLDMPASSDVNIELYDVIGNKIESVHNGYLQEGTNNIAINKANELNAGMYMLKVDIETTKGTNTYTERLIVR